MGHLALDGLPPGPMLLEQFQYLHVLCDGPLVLVDSRPQVVQVLVPDLLPRPVYIAIGVLVKC